MSKSSISTIEHNISKDHHASHCSKKPDNSCFEVMSLQASVWEGRLLDVANTLLMNNEISNEHINKRDDSGWSPFHEAVAASNPIMTSLLLLRGANPNIPGNHLISPLHIAAQQGSTSIVELLLSAGADPNAASSFGQTPLTLANKSNMALQQLLQHPPQARSASRLTSKSLLEAIKLRKWGYIPKTNETDSAYCEPLLRTPIYEHKSIYPLHLAVASCHLGVVDDFLSGGADVNQPTAEGNTPLHIAVMTGDASIVWRLLGAGADVSLRNSDGNTPLDFSKTKPKTPATDVLRTYSEFYRIFSKNEVDRRIFLSAKHKRIDCKNRRSRQDSMYTNTQVAENKSDQREYHVPAVKKPNATKQERRITSSTLKKNLDINQSSVHLLARKGQTEQLRTLIRTVPADINERDRRGRTPLYSAVRANQFTAVRLLLQNGADPCLAGPHGDAPLHIAASLGFVKIAKELVQYGADPMQVNEDFNTCLSVCPTRLQSVIFPGYFKKSKRKKSQKQSTPQPKKANKRRPCNNNRQIKKQSSLCRDKSNKKSSKAVFQRSKNRVKDFCITSRKQRPLLLSTGTSESSKNKDGSSLPKDVAINHVQKCQNLFEAKSPSLPWEKSHDIEPNCQNEINSGNNKEAEDMADSRRQSQQCLDDHNSDVEDMPVASWDQPQFSHNHQVETIDDVPFITMKLAQDPCDYCWDKWCADNLITCIEGTSIAASRCGYLPADILDSDIEHASITL